MHKVLVPIVKKKGGPASSNPAPTPSIILSGSHGARAWHSKIRVCAILDLAVPQLCFVHVQSTGSRCARSCWTCCNVWSCIRHDSSALGSTANVGYCGQTGPGCIVPVVPVVSRLVLPCPVLSCRVPLTAPVTVPPLLLFVPLRLLRLGAHRLFLATIQAPRHTLRALACWPTCRPTARQSLQRSGSGSLEAADCVQRLAGASTVSLPHLHIYHLPYLPSRIPDRVLAPVDDKRVGDTPSSTSGG